MPVLQQYWHKLQKAVFLSKTMVDKYNGHGGWGMHHVPFVLCVQISNQHNDNVCLAGCAKFFGLWHALVLASTVNAMVVVDCRDCVVRHSCVVSAI